MKTMTIENFLTWAFTQELWKVGAGGGVSAVSASNWSMVYNFGELCTLIDRTPNFFGVVPGFEEGEPHPDALAAGQAVKALASAGLMPPADWSPFPEFEDPHGAIAEEVERVLAQWRLNGERSNGERLVALTIRCAVMGRGPDWRADRPRFQPAMKWGNPAWFVVRRRKDSFGRVYSYEADGYDKRAKRPVKGAYMKYRLAEPMRSSIMDRLDWILWQNGLERLQASLANHLHDHRLSEFTALRTPWEISENSPQVIDKAS